MLIFFNLRTFDKIFEIFRHALHAVNWTKNNSNILQEDRLQLK